MDSAPTISTQALTRRFGELLAVDGVDLQVAPGQFFGFLGPNGAGKSTTINAHPVEVKRQIGVVPEGMALFGRLTGSEFLNFAGRMYGLDRETAARRTVELLDFMQLADNPKKLVTDYSHGMQKKLAMAAAVIHGQVDAARHDRARGHDFSDLTCTRNCRKAVQPRRHHSQRPACGAGISGRTPRWRGSTDAHRIRQQRRSSR